MLKYLVFAIVLPLSAQIEGAWTYESAEVLKAYNVKGVSSLRLDACNIGTTERLVDPARFRLAAPAIPLLTPDHAHTVIEFSLGKSKTAMTVEALSYAALGVAAFSGQSWVAAHPKAIQGLALATGLGMQFQSKLKGKMPDLSRLFIDELNAPVRLPPGGCVTKTAFATKTRKTAAVKFRIE